MARYDLVVTNGTLVLPYQGEVRADLAARDGRIVALADEIAPGDGEEVIDATGKFVFPGAVDAHFHIGIFRPLALDAFEETRSSLVGGATTVLSYFRTGAHYLDRTGPYEEIFPEVLNTVGGHAHADYGFHLAPMDARQVGEVSSLVDAGVASFKYYMFYKGFDLASNSRDATSFTMSEEYDLGHLFTIMEQVAAADARSPGRVSLSLHCEQSELMRLFIERVRASGRPQNLRAYSEGRPPLTERVAIGEATTLASAAGCPVNLLHLSSGEALGAAVQARQLYPQLDMRFEVTLHHLCLDHDDLDRADRDHGGGLGGKVNPPIRAHADNEVLWRGVLDGTVNWVASDHACCMESQKGDELWPATPGFGGTALLYPVMVSEGHHKRGLPLSRIAELVSANPARAYNAAPRKGSLSIGADADLTVIDLDVEKVVTTDLLLSGQDHTPFAGVPVKGWPVATVLRGRKVYENGKVLGQPTGEYLPRSGR